MIVFVDSNIPMYLVGAPHPHKRDAQMLLERSVASGDRLVTDVEVFQEILHRYVAIERRDAIQPAFEALLGIVDEVFPVHLDDVEAAKSILLGGRKRLSARDALHAAVMQRRRLTHILTFDAGFDHHPGIKRLR